MMERKVDMTPLTGFLERERNSQLGWGKAVAELVDNAFDANASQVKIEFAGKRFSISDDGCGAKDIQAMLRLGDHRRNRKESLGRYGVGTKIAAVWAWGTTTIATNRDGKISVARVNWSEVERSERWEFTVTEHESTPALCAAHGLPVDHGTVISFDGTDRKFRPLKELVETLSYKFAPAIKQGKQIRVKHPQQRRGDTCVAEYLHPRLESIIEREFEVDGKKARVRAGVVPSGQHNPLPGFTFVHRHRVLATNTNGCGEYTTGRFFGWVELIGDGWKLSVTKDGISEGEDELYAALESICRDQLQRASEEARDVELAGLESSLSNAMTDALCEQQKKKSKRKPGNKKGTVDPKDTDAEHKTASQSQEGPKTLLVPCPDKGGGSKRIGDKIKVTFSDEQNMGVIGRVDHNDKCTHVTLYMEHPAVKWAAEGRNSQGLAILTAALIAMFAASAESDAVKQKLLAFAKDEGLGLMDQLIRALSAYTLYVKDKCDHEAVAA